MTYKVAVMKRKLYFCGVKNIVRYEAAALRSVFCIGRNSNIKRIEWGNSNVPKAFAQCGLTARNTLILFNV